MGDLEAARRLGGSTKLGKVKLSSILAVVLLGIILLHTLSTSNSSSLSSSSKPCSSVGSRDVVAVSMVTMSRGAETVLTWCRNGCQSIFVALRDEGKRKTTRT